MLRALAFVGPVIEAVAVAQQLQWHARHGDAEPVASFLLAHSGILAGALLGMVGAAAWVRAARWRLGATVVLVGAVVRVAALVIDSAAHRSGWSVVLGHELFRAGIGIALAGVALAFATRTPGASEA